MKNWKILLSNLGYARNIDGRLWSHIRNATRYLWCPPAVQQESLRLFGGIINAEQPDLCCLIEIDRGSLNSAWFDQLTPLVDGDYRFFDIENKYGNGHAHRPVMGGKCNGFISRWPVRFDKHYLQAGTKRLVYVVQLADNLTVVFGHFSLRRAVRARQFAELRQLADGLPGEVVILGDFNTFAGFDELSPLLDNSRYLVMNDAKLCTFKFSGLAMCLDLVLCTPGIAARCTVRIVPQPFSDHDAVVVEIAPG